MTGARFNFALLHSPLLGPATWGRLAPELRAAGHDAVVLRMDDDGRAPFWRQHARSATAGFEGAAAGSGLVLVPHSGAGPLAPAIALAQPATISACIFFDAGLPGGGSRYEALVTEMGDKFAGEFRAHLDGGGSYPGWRDEDLASLVPRRADRAALLGEMRPRSADFWDERFDFDEALPFPCAYLRTSAAYWRPAAESRRRGWPVSELEAGHFAMLSEPAAVARELVRLAGMILS